MIKLSNTHLVIGISIISVGLAALAFSGPLWQKRDERADQQIMNDFYEISAAVEGYVFDKNQLPLSLDDLGLREEVKSRISENDYRLEVDDSFGSSYKLCATFKTEGSANSFDYYLPESKGHKAGPDCLDYEAYNTKLYDDSYYNDDFTEDFDLELNDNESSLESLDDTTEDPSAL
jgi:hypothetical protein